MAPSMEDAAAQSARAAINAAISARFGDDGVESAIDIVHAVGLCAVRVQTRADAVIEARGRRFCRGRGELGRRIEHYRKNRLQTAGRTRWKMRGESREKCEVPTTTAADFRCVHLRVKQSGWVSLSLFIDGGLYQLPDQDLVRAFEELSHHDDPMVDAEDAADLLEAREADLDYIDQFIDPYDYDDNPYA